jgi:hypothetical protein
VADKKVQRAQFKSADGKFLSGPDRESARLLFNETTRTFVGQDNGKKAL